ncbi:MAG: DNA polymerase III subunit gamma/tau [Thermodesulfobacteriota bacterium]
MAYLVLARKYRPQQFEDVVEQLHVTQTLSNAVASGRLAHAILLAGPRGTGKTTIARILAKSMNCAAGPSPVACNNCRSCREITESHAADVFEIDGASNNKVENVRELRENARYMPAHSPYKIYVIDEVHMLSDAAFNALLKILEEPPAHVLFFFATTEPNKIPITILSRCQRHDLRRVSLDGIVGHLDRLCRAEGIDISEKGLSLIAREADGSIRDSLSLLDQILTCSDGTITDEQIIDILGVIDRQVLFDVSDALFNGQMDKLLEICDLLYRQGRHLMKFYAELVEHFRNLLVVKMGGSSHALTGVAEHERRIMAQQAESVTEPYVNQVLNTLFADEWQIKQSVSPKIAMEMTFFKLVQIQPALSLDTLIEKLDQLKSGVAPTAAAAKDEGGSVPPAPGTDAPASPAADSADNAQTRQVTSKPAGNAPIEDCPPEPAPPPEPEMSAEATAEKAANHRLPDTEPAPVQKASPAQAPEAASPADEPAAAADDPAAAWQALRSWVCEKSPALGACLADGMLESITGDRIDIRVRSDSANVNFLSREKSVKNLETLCGQYFGKPMQVSVGIEQTGAAAGNRKKEEKQLKEETLNHPMVDAAIKTFNGRIVDIKILQ